MSEALVTLLPYIPPGKKRKGRPRLKVRVVWGQVDQKATRIEPRVYESFLRKDFCLCQEKWPAGAEWLAFEILPRKIAVLGPCWIQRIYDEVEARVKGVWI